MDHSRVWKSRGHRGLINYPLKYTPFGLSENNLGKLNLVGFEETVEKIVRRICKCQLTPLIQSSSGRKRIESTCQKETRPQIVCWTCKGLGHYSRDCAENKTKSKSKIVKRWKSKVLTRTVGLQTAFL
jgi:hypothetical protein